MAFVTERPLFLVLENFVFLKQNHAIWWILLGANLITVMKTKFQFFRLNDPFVYSGGIKGGGMGENAPPPPPSKALPPLAPPVRRKKWLKSAIFGNFLDFCPLRIAFCPLDAPPQKNFWCRHCLFIMDELHWRAGLIHRPSSLRSNTEGIYPTTTLCMIVLNLTL